MLWAAVPKTAIDKQSQFALWKNEIRPARYFDVPMPPGYVQSLKRDFIGSIQS
jgi:hypothetical protein